MKARRFDFYPDDWLAGTMTLDMVDRGVYITAISAMYSHGGSIKKNELRRLCPMHGNSFNSCIKKLLSLGKLIGKGDDFTQKRVASEVKKAAKRVRSAVENGRKGGRPRININELEKPNGLQNAKPNRKLPSPSPSPSPEEEDSEVRTSGADAPADPVKVVWDKGLAILGSGQRALLGKLRKTYGDPALLAAIVSCESEHPSEPAAFLVACCERSKVNGRGADGHARALETLARAAIEYDERQDRGGFDKAPH